MNFADKTNLKRLCIAILDYLDLLKGERFGFTGVKRRGHR